MPLRDVNMVEVKVSPDHCGSGHRAKESGEDTRRASCHQEVH